MKIWNIFWTDRKGCYRQRLFTDADKLAKFCETLRLDAVIKDREQNVVGQVLQVQEPRRKWGWWFDTLDDSTNRTHWTPCE